MAAAMFQAATKFSLSACYPIGFFRPVHMTTHSTLPLFPDVENGKPEQLFYDKKLL
jgi:hypothetical protein